MAKTKQTTAKAEKKTSKTKAKTPIHLTKSLIVENLAKNQEITKVSAEKFVSFVLSQVSGALETGGSVSLVGFGSFSVKKRAERKVRHPQSGEIIKVPATNVPSFNAGKALREKVK